MQHFHNTEPRPDPFVRLARDVPELGLSRGEVGVICSTWFAPAAVYEVEFGGMGTRETTRALLFGHQIEPTSLLPPAPCDAAPRPAAAP
jgi:hypothetical protein